jgi:hypothetical protein
VNIYLRVAKMIQVMYESHDPITLIALIAVLSVFALEQSCFYKKVKETLEDETKQPLSTNQKGYLMSLKCSIVLFLMSMYFLQRFIASGGDISVYGMSLSNVERSMMVLATVYFTAYLIVDMYIGSTEYHNIMMSLGGYPHHIVYIMINLYTLYTGTYPLYILLMIAEASTILLASGNIDKKLRSDKWFGITFLLCRIVIFGALLYKIPSSIGFAVLGLHLYWFFNWCRKYGKNMFSINKGGHDIA